MTKKLTKIFGLSATLCLLFGWALMTEGRQTGNVQGRLLYLNKPVTGKVLLLAKPRPVGVLFSLNSKPEGKEVTTNSDGTFLFNQIAEGEYTLYDPMGKSDDTVYESILWFDQEIMEGGTVKVNPGFVTDLGTMSYIRRDNSKIAPKEESVVGFTPRLVWGPYPEATKYRVILISEPAGLDLEHGLTEYKPNHSTVLFLDSTMDLSAQLSRPLPRNRTAPTGVRRNTYTIYVYYLNDAIPIAIGNLQFYVDW